MLNVHYIRNNDELTQDAFVEGLKELATDREIYVVADIYDDDRSRTKYINKPFPTFYVYIKGYEPFFVNTFYGDLRGASFIDEKCLKWKVPSEEKLDYMRPSMSPIGQMTIQMTLMKMVLMNNKNKDIWKHFPEKGLFCSFFGEYKGVETIADKLGIKVSNIEPDIDTIVKYIKDECMNESCREREDMLDYFLEISDICCMRNYINVEDEVRDIISNEDNDHDKDSFSETWELINDGEILYDNDFCAGDNNDITIDKSFEMEEEENRIKFMSTNIFIKDVHINPIFRSHKINTILAYITEFNCYENPCGERLKYLKSIVPTSEYIDFDLNGNERFPTEIYDDIIMPEIHKLNINNHFYVIPFDWYPKTRKYELEIDKILDESMCALIYENLEDKYDTNKVYKWLHQNYPDMMMDLARILRTDVLKNRENYNTIHITDMTITAEHLNIDLSRLKSILNDLPEELLCAPSPEQNKDQGDIPF